MGRGQQDYGASNAVYTYDKAQERYPGWVNLKEDVIPFLVSCPVCGGKSFETVHNWERDYFILCKDCGSTGPLVKSPRLLLHTWEQARWTAADRVSSYLLIDYFECRFCGCLEYYKSNGKYICDRCKASIPINVISIKARLPAPLHIDKTPVMQTRFYHVLGHTKDTGERVHYYKHRCEENAIEQLVALSKLKSNILYHIKIVGEENG